MEKELASLRRRNVAERATNMSENVSKDQVPCVRQLLSAKKPRVVSENCDIVIVFGAKANGTIFEWLLKKLRESIGLNVQVRHHDSVQSSVFDVYTPFKKLLEVADEHHLPKKLKPAHGNTLREFRQHDLNQFENSNDEDRFFSSQERQWLTLKIVENIRIDSTDLLLLDGLSLHENELLIPKCQAVDIIEEIYPLHEIVALQRLQKTWVHDCGKQPLDDVNNYFGVEIGLYFAWLGHYTVALTIPAVLGLIFWLFFCGRNQYVEDVAYLIFCLLNLIWVSVYLQCWKRYLIQLAYQWGLLNEQQILKTQPMILSSESLDPTKTAQSVTPLFRWYITISVMVFSIGLVFIMMMLSFRLQDWWDLKLRSFQFQWICLSYIPKICLAIIISLMDHAYYKIAIWLKEYRLEMEFENHLIREITLFQFINSFLSLFYIAFYVQDHVRLKEQLVILLIVRQAINNLTESTIPYMFEQMHLAKFNYGFWSAFIPNRLRDRDRTGSETSNDATSDTRSDINQADLERTLYKYKGTFDGYLEIVMQFGYVVLFSSTFPLAGVCALLNNIIQIRCGAFKLVYVYQRPFGQRNSNIRNWQDMMTYISLIAIIVNCALIGVSGQVHRLLPNMTATQTMLLIVILEHIMFGLRFLMTYIYPDVPESLIDNLSKLERQRCGNTKITKICEPITRLDQETNKLQVSSRDLTVKSNLTKSRIVLPEIPPYKPKPIKYRESSEESTDDKPRLISGLTNSFEWDGPLQAVPKKGNTEKMSLEPGYCTLSSQDSIKWADSNQSIFSPDDKVNQNEDESAVKKTRLKQKLIKRARSVAIFSLKLKERRARESKSIPSTTEEFPPTRSGGELSCIPIEKIIQVDDVRIDKNMQSGTI